jgi:hypothetical protein
LRCLDSIYHMYRLSIWLIALTFVFNGVALHAWIDPPTAPALIAQDHHGAADAAGHDEHSDKVVATAADHGQDHAYNHLKCCGVCSVASVLPDAAAISVPISYAAVTFRTARHDLVGHLVALDPDIPKTIV